MPATIVPILQLARTLIVPIQDDLHDRQIADLQSQILGRIEAIGATGLVLDISAMELVDSYMARVLGEIAMMAGLMGARAVIVGMSPAIAIVLMDLGLQLGAVPTARNLEKGLGLLAALLAGEAEAPHGT